MLSRTTFGNASAYVLYVLSMCAIGPLYRVYVMSTSGLGSDLARATAIVGILTSDPVRCPDPFVGILAQTFELRSMDFVGIWDLTSYRVL